MLTRLAPLLRAAPLLRVYYVSRYQVTVGVHLASIHDVFQQVQQHIDVNCIQQSRRMGHAVPAHWKSMRQVCEENKAHMNFLPVPEGSWQEAYNKQNAKYNQLLALSVLSVVVTAFALWQTGSIYLHTAPPMRNKRKE